MSDKKLDEFRRQQAEEDFFRMAAAEIDQENNADFWEAQDLPDPPAEVMERMRNGLDSDMKKASQTRTRKKIGLFFGRMIACVAVVCSIAFVGTYVSVEAAREGVNNFVLNLFDGNAVMQTEVTQKKASGVTLPEDWNGSFDITWVPERFTDVRAKSLDGYWLLIYYDEETCTEDLIIYVWTASSAPTIDTEGLELISEVEIQGSQAQIYQKDGPNQHILLWARQDYLIQISGTVTAEEIQKIAKNFMF